MKQVGLFIQGYGPSMDYDHVGKREAEFRVKGREGNTYTLMSHLH